MRSIFPQWDPHVGKRIGDAAKLGPIDSTDFARSGRDAPYPGPSAEEGPPDDFFDSRADRCLPPEPLGRLLSTAALPFFGKAGLLKQPDIR